MAVGGLSDSQLSELQNALEEGVERLSRSFPMSLAVVAVRDSEGKVVTVAGEVAQHLGGLVEERPPVTTAAFDWVDVNRRILTLTVGAKLRVSELYQPMIELGLESGMVAPILRDDVLLGVLIIGSRHVGGYTPAELEMVQDCASELAQYLVVTRPAVSAAGQAGQPVEPEKPSIAEVEERLREVARQLVGQAKARVGERTPARAPEPHPAPVEAVPVQGAPEGITVRADELGRIRTWDSRAEELFGWRADEVIGRFLTLLVRDKSRNVLDIRLRDRLLAHGSFVGRTISWRRDGMPVVCIIRLSRVGDEPEGVGGFIGHIEAVPPSTLLPHEPVELGFAELYDFSKRLS